MSIFQKLFKETVVYGGADLFSKIISFITFPIIAAALSPKAFGALELILTITTLLALVLGCGLNNSVQRYYWDQDILPDQQPVIVSSGLAAQMLFGIAAVTLALFVLPFLLPAIRSANMPFTWIAIAAALILMVSQLWVQYLLDVVRLHFASYKFFALSLLSRVFGVILSLLVVVYWRWGVDGLLSVRAIVALFVLPIAIWMVRGDITLKIDRFWFRELIIYGYPFIFSSFAYWLFGSMDRWLLATMSSVEEVGIYSVSFKFSSVVLFVSAAFGKAWSPLAIKLRTDNPENYRLIYAQVLLLLLFVMLIIGGGVALFAGELIGIFMPVEYSSSALPLALLCFAVILQATQQVTAVGISLEKKTYIFARVTWMTALINLALNIKLIPSYGAVGAAYATVVSYLVLTGSYLYYTQKLHPLPIPWVKLVFILLIGVIVALAAIIFNTTLFSLKMVVFKSVFSISCVFIAWVVLPIRRLEFER